MEKEFKKLFSGLLQDASDKADEGKLLVKNAIHKITGSPTQNEQTAKKGSSRTQGSVAGKKETSVQKTSAFQQNLRKLKEYSNDPVLDDDFSEKGKTAEKVPAIKSEEKRASGINPKARPASPASDKRRIEAVYSDTDLSDPLSPVAFDPLSSDESDQLVEDIEAEKKKLSERIANWQQTLSEEMGYSFSATEENVQINESLLERLQTVLDLISGQINQIQAKKNEQEAQKLLFDSTYDTLNQEREAYRLSIEDLTRQISQKHDELSKYLVHWEEDSQLWTDRKNEVEGLRQDARKAQQLYQQTIASHVNQLETRQQTLSELEDKMREQKAESEKTLEAIRSIKETSNVTQEGYRQQIAEYVNQLQMKQAELEQYMTSWDAKLLEWKQKAQELQDSRHAWDTLLTNAEQQISERQNTLTNYQDTAAQQIKQQQEDYQHWLNQQLATLDIKKKELSDKGDLALNAISAFNQDIMDKHNYLVQEIEKRIQTQQRQFDEKQKQLATLAGEQINVLAEKLAQSKEAYAALSKEHQQQLAEALANQPDLVTETIWKNRVSYAVTFLPQLPVYVSSDDLSALFGGIDIHFKSPYVPPVEATIQIKWHLFEQLPEAEKTLIKMLCKEISANYRIEFHPIVQMLSQ